MGRAIDLLALARILLPSLRRNAITNPLERNAVQVHVSTRGSQVPKHKVGIKSDTCAATLAAGILGDTILGPSRSVCRHVRTFQVYLQT